MYLPMIGRRTAGSIISSAFDLPTPILDGNVKRIFLDCLLVRELLLKMRKNCGNIVIS